MEKPELYGIIGNPVKHSLSPVIHNFLFEKYKINARYHLFEIQKNQLRQAIEGLRILGIKGINVTAPFKERVIPYLDKMKSEATPVGAINTIHNVKGRLIGYNTDIYGIRKTIELKLKFSAQGRKIAILGAGGAAKTCAYTLLRYHPQELLIFSRHIEKARQLGKQFSRWSNDTSIAVHTLKDLQKLLTMKKLDLIINATSGNNSLIKDTLTEILEMPQSEIKIFDLKYHSMQQNKVLNNKANFIDGTYMLVAQALESFYIWTKIKPEFETVLKLVSNYIKRGKYA